MVPLDQVYEARPFKVRNADEMDLSTVLDLFVDPTKSLSNPFDYENSIVKGRMGCGKTMYLKANQAYYLYTLIPALLEAAEPVLPVYIRLSDYQHVTDPRDIFKQLILRIVREMAVAYRTLMSADCLHRLHKGFSTLPSRLATVDPRIQSLVDDYRRLSADEYVETVRSQTGMGATASPSIFQAFVNYTNTSETTLRGKELPGIQEVEDAYDAILGTTGGKVMLLLDEAGSISRSFFRSEQEGQSYFEILMNQLRTAQFVRTKIAVYPQSYSDVLTETRYGDIVLLQEDVESEQGYHSFHTRATAIIGKYCSNAIGQSVTGHDIFAVSSSDGLDPTEQLINASYGNMRRFVNLIDLSFAEAYAADPSGKVTYDIVLRALGKHSESIEQMFTDSDRTFLGSIATACRTRGTFRFRFPGSAPALYRYLSKSSEYNVLNIVEAGVGRRSTVYAFDYSFCVRNQIPTHYLKDTERIDRTRGRTSGVWIGRISTISDEVLRNAQMPGKIDGEIEWLRDEKGFIKGADQNMYYFDSGYIIAADRAKYLHVGKIVRFYPTRIEDALFAMNVEVP
jgi:hypothetical protein